VILGLVDEAVAAGARQHKACEILGLDARTVQRWRGQDTGDDQRRGPRTEPANKLNDAERDAILKTVNLPEFRGLSVKQIVPTLADSGVYLASESTMYRVLHAEDQVAHRAPSRPPQARTRPREAVATEPNQVWSWDITYLPGPIRGSFYYLYMIVDVFSRKVVGHAVHESECASLAASLMRASCADEELVQRPLVLHSDNGGPMKGATMLATLQELGVMASFSRPSVSNDNAFSESLFRTVKYRPEYPSRPFPSLEAARAWVDRFVRWYNYEHRHSGIKFVTPAERHAGDDQAILAHRAQVYARARARSPQRWAGKTRDWSRVDVVRLNPEPRHDASEVA
jgi:transposase InsO family protein